MKVVCLLSGGLDSSTLLYKLLADDHEVIAVSFDYNQRHSRELLSASQIASFRQVPHILIPLSAVANSVLKGSSQTTPSIPPPDGHYTEQSMKVTVVPNRNMLLIALATAAAISHGASLVAYAAHAGDHAIYPDCRPEFIYAMREALKLCHFEPIQLLAPFAWMSKADIVELGTRLGVPYNWTYSCYNGEVQHCGRCGTCTERREAFILAGVHDPTDYVQPLAPLAQPR